MTEKTFVFSGTIKGEETKVRCYATDLAIFVNASAKETIFVEVESEEYPGEYSGTQIRKGNVEWSGVDS